MGPHDNDTERFSKTCSSSSKVSSKTQFHSMSPNHLPHVELYHKAGFPFGHKIAASSFWGIYASSLMSTVRPTMLHNSRVHHSQNWIKHHTNDTYKVLSPQVWWRVEGVFLYHQAILGLQLGVLQFNIILTLSTQRLHQISQVKGLVPQNCSSPSLDPSHKSRSWLVILTGWLYMGGSKVPLLPWVWLIC